MKKFKFLGVVAFAFLLSMNAGVFLDSNNWDSTTEVAEAQIAPAPGPVVIAVRGQEFGIFCNFFGQVGLRVTCVWNPWNTCTPRACALF